jgi:hypothetical protein
LWQDFSTTVYIYISRIPQIFHKVFPVYQNKNGSISPQNSDHVHAIAILKCLFCVRATFAPYSLL